MKTIGKKSTVLLLVLAILGTCFMSFGWSKREKAQALASDIDTIYYLTDYYPTLSYDALYDAFGVPMNISTTESVKRNDLI